MSSTTHLGWLLASQQRWSEAEPLFRELYDDAARAQAGPERAARYLSYHGPCLVKLARYDEAEPRLREAHDRLKQTGQYDHQRKRAVVEALVELLENTNRREEAARLRAELQESRAATQPVATAP